MLPVITYLFAQLANPAWNSVLGSSSVELASRSFSLERRYDVPSVNAVFRDNILLTLSYMDGRIKSKDEISWPDVGKPFHSEFTLAP